MGWTIGREDGFPQTVMTQTGQGWDGGSRKGCLNLGGGVVVVTEGCMEEGRAELCYGDSDKSDWLKVP